MAEKPFGLALRAIILDDQGRCLLVRRSKANRHYVGAWEWPGGKAENGETFDAGVRREVREETGLEVTLLKLALAFQVEMTALHLVVLCMEARVAGGALCLSAEHDESAWVSLDRLGERALPDGVREHMLAYAAKKGAGQ